MSQEIELKLRLTPRTAAALDRHPLLNNQAARKRSLQNTYYDTPDLRLRERAVALRFRRSGDEWLLTVKGGAPSTGGLAARAEWEASARPGEFDFTHVGDAELRHFLESNRNQLTPIFSTNFQRDTWLLQYRNTAIELALDRGHVTAGRRRAPICELEMELIDSANPTPLFALALELAESLALHPEPVSKAERGYTLFLGRPTEPTTAGKSPVRPEMIPQAAFRAIALDCLGQLQRNEAGVLAGRHPEFVHQSRVAIRRLRSALCFFAPRLPADFVATYREPWREVARVLGATRNWDVLLGETLERLPPDILDGSQRQKLQALAQAEQSAAFRVTRAALKRRSYGRFLLLFMADVLALPDQENEARRKLRGFTTERLHQRWEKTRRQIKRHGIENAATRHALRIRMKKLRYTLELLAPALPNKQTSRIQRKAAQLQNLLGQINDLAAARQFLATRAPRLRALDDWLANEHGARLGLTEQALVRFRKKSPWSRHNKKID